jgi:hypothetical protein
VTTPVKPEDRRRTEALDELKKIHLELSRLYELIDSFADVFLNSRFPHGQPNDRWSRHS